ncbi:MAG TPA: hypothetical protein VH682_00155 [Gemmataceae bacterium]|jgi:hypothetical protein
MRVRLWLPALTSVTLALIGFSARPAQAGSFFGPNCYGSDYAYEYPNRAHNVFGFGPCTQCQAKHPLFKHRLFHKNQDLPPNGGGPANAMMAPNGMPANAMMAPNGMPANAMMAPNGMPANALPANAMMAPNGMPANAMMAPNGMQANGIPVEYVQAPVVQAPVVQTPVVQAPVMTPAQTTSGVSGPVPATPAVSSRIAPVPAPLPTGPVNPEPPAGEQSSKPPF